MTEKKCLGDTNDKNIPAELLDLANVLEKLDDSFSANIIRKHVASHLTNELFKLPNGDRTYRSLASIFIGESIASSMVEAALKDEPSKEKAHELLSYYIDQENHEKARYLLKSAWLENYDLPDSAELKLALLEHNPAKVLQLVKFSLFLTPGERLAALNKIGEKKLAWEVGINAIEDQNRTAEHPLLLNGLSTIHQERVYALRFQHKSFSQWDVTENELGYYQPLGNGYVRLFARDIYSGRQKLLNRDFKLVKKDYSDEIITHILDGGYPEIIELEGLSKQLWFTSYIATYIERDARDLADIRDIDSFIKFVNLLATRSATILNKSSLSNDIGIKDITTDNYISIITRIYQATLLKPYFVNIGKQFVKSPKVFFNDTGVLCSLLNINSKEQLLN